MAILEDPRDEFPIRKHSAWTYFQTQSDETTDVLLPTAMACSGRWCKMLKYLRYAACACCIFLLIYLSVSILLASGTETFEKSYDRASSVQRLFNSMKVNFGFLCLIFPIFQCKPPITIKAGVGCKSVPGSYGWPQPKSWHRLNGTIGGALLRPLPPAAVCDPTRLSVFNTTACRDVASQWYKTSFHADDPVSVDWPNWQHDACLPTGIYNDTEICSTESFPMYVVNATSAWQVANAVKFAAEHDIRISVKGTGHDFLGRSTAPGLSIWTHNIRGMEIHDSFIPERCADCSLETAITIAAGQRLGEVYQKAATESLTVVLGADPNVGIGGYVTGGGHSPISAKYGLAVDNVLEMQVVTPSGDIVIANRFQNQDLFWAMNGGGGATFGVLINVTLRTFPPISLTIFVLQFNSTDEEAYQNNNTNWYSALAYFYSQIPKLSNAGLMGYFWSFPLSNGAYSEVVSLQAPSGPKPMRFLFEAWAIDASVAQVESMIAPVLGRLQETSGIKMEIKVIGTAPLYAIALNPEPAGSNVRLVSRLWDEKALANGSDLVETLRVFEGLQGLLVSGPGVRNESLNDTNSVNPIWRRTYVHLISGGSFPFRNVTAEKSSSSYITNQLGSALRSRAPDMGCYLNEADVDEPNYQHAFWGSHYPRLLKIKHELDPKGLFWCSTCVGAEEWSLRSDGSLCSA